MQQVDAVDRAVQIDLSILEILWELLNAIKALKLSGCLVRGLIVGAYAFSGTHLLEKPDKQVVGNPKHM